MPQEVQDYYDKYQWVYSLLWSKDYLHYGLWFDKTKSLKEALKNTDLFVVKKGDISEKSVVLDAGCGIGGSARHIASLTSAKVYGISISDVQIKRAKERSESVKFSKQDFTKTNFKNNTFDVVYGIESISHAESKLDFLKEASRILKPGGRLVVVDGYLNKNVDPKEKKVMDEAISGWAVPNLATVEEFTKYAKEVGFQKCGFENLDKHIEPSVHKIYRLGIIFYPIFWCLRRLRIAPIELENHFKTSLTQKKLAGKAAVYGCFTAEKSK